MEFMKAQVSELLNFFNCYGCVWPLVNVFVLIAVSLRIQGVSKIKTCLEMCSTVTSLYLRFL